MTTQLSRRQEKRVLALQKLCPLCRGEKYGVDASIAFFAVLPCAYCRGVGTIRKVFAR